MLDIAIFDSRKEIKGKIGLSIALSAYSLLMILLFPSIKESGVDFSEYIKSLPPAIQKAFGASFVNFLEIEGFLGVEMYSWIWVLALGAYFAYKGGALISGDVEGQRIDLILSNPISRSRVLLEKYLSLVPAMFLINLFVFLTTLGGTYLLLENPINFSSLFKVHLLSFPFWLACTSIGIFLSVNIDEERKAELYSAGTIFGTYLIETVTIDTDFDLLSNFSFTHYYKPVNLLNGTSVDYYNVLILSLATIVILLISIYLFERKDIRT